MTTEQESPEIELVPADSDPAPEEAQEGRDEIHQPAKVMRIASMVRTLLDEVRAAPLDEASRTRLKDIYSTSVQELSEVLSEDLREELDRLSLPFDDGAPSDAELRVAHAQLVGWLEGLFHGIQAMLFAQQMESRARLDQFRTTRGLPAGPGGEAMPAEGPGDTPGSHGQYL